MDLNKNKWKKEAGNEGDKSSLSKERFINKKAPWFYTQYVTQYPRGGRCQGHKYQPAFGRVRGGAAKCAFASFVGKDRGILLNCTTGNSSSQT